MVRLIADRLLALPPICSTDADIAHTQHLLRMPAENHTPADIEQIGKIDRFVAPEGFWDAVWQEGRVMDDASYREFVIPVRTPLPHFWFEYRGDPRQGWLFEGDKGTCFHVVSPEPGGIFPVGSVSLSAFSEGRQYWAKTKFTDDLVRAEDFEKFRDVCLFSIFAVLAAISSSRAVSIQRVHRNESPSQRAFAKSREKIGRPIFSYNQIKLVIPNTCLYRGEPRKINSLNGVRGHMVIGHWRLIDGALEPFWTWIEGHERGDQSRGWIIKERQLVYLGGGIRRGFLIPDCAGSHGERRIAELAL